MQSRQVVQYTDYLRNKKPLFISYNSLVGEAVSGIKEACEGLSGANMMNPIKLKEASTDILANLTKLTPILVASSLLLDDLTIIEEECEEVEV